ncbi:MAG: hypothetical protein HY908_18425 [Myxococcales bacterium]|nr:hypothetical protein [Myxococcales bacterium]
MADSLQRLAYVAAAATSHPVSVGLELVQRYRVTTTCPTAKDASASREHIEERTLLTYNLLLAHSARRESIVYPARDLVSIKCADEPCKDADRCPIRAGETFAIDDDALSKRECTVEPNVALVSGADGEALSRLMGSQRVVVTVARDGTAGARAVYTVASVDQFDLVVPAPDDDDNGRGVYRVTVQPGALQRNDPIKYRESDALTVDGDETGATYTGLTYDAILRPRGPFGFPCQGECVRVYVTASTTLTGFRFPANPSTLETSSDPTSYQVVPPRLGLLAVLEPWDYADAANPIPLNLALAAGANFVDFSREDVRFSAVAGLMAQLPVLKDETGQLGASLALGVLWENDLRGRNAFLTTVGLNIGSIFSPPTK